MLSRHERVVLYRAWSVRASREASASAHEKARQRCTHSASVWSMVADALEAGDDQEVRRLTSNLTLLTQNSWAPPH